MSEKFFRAVNASVCVESMMLLPFLDKIAATAAAPAATGAIGDMNTGAIMRISPEILLLVISGFV